MTTNKFIDLFTATNEQTLYANLIEESIKMYGHDVYYVPRVLNNYDSVYGADDQSSYEKAYMVEVYIKNIDGFSGDGEFLQKFGIEIRNQVVFSISVRRFDSEIGHIEGIPRPNEGDIIFFPLNNKCFQIKYVNKFEMFYQLGTLFTWEMTCELFEYSAETFSTGIPEIDAIQKLNDVNQYTWAVKDEAGEPITDEDGDIIVIKTTEDQVIPANNKDIQDEANTFVEFSPTNPFGEV